MFKDGQKNAEEAGLVSEGRLRQMMSDALDLLVESHDPAPRE
jgi:hypothetical protein